MKRTITIAAALTVALTAAPAAADIELEAGATFDGGICWEADGTEGIATFDGQCLTPADYDAIYSFENLSQLPTAQTCWPGTGCAVGDAGVESIAESAGMTPADDPASERPLGDGLVDEPFTFVEAVERAHAAHLPIAD
jgi:hypothetical protein